MTSKRFVYKYNNVFRFTALSTLLSFFESSLKFVIFIQLHLSNVCQGKQKSIYVEEYTKMMRTGKTRTTLNRRGKIPFSDAVIVSIFILLFHRVNLQSHLAVVDLFRVPMTRSCLMV